MSLFDGFLRTLGTRLVGLLTAAVASVVTARILGPEGKGVVVILGTLAATMVQFGSLGLTAANVHFTARGGEQVSRLAGTSAWVALGAGGGLGIVVLAGAAWRPDLLPGVPLVLLLVTVLSLPFLLGSQLFQNLLLGMEAIRAYNGLELLRTGLGLGAVLGLFGLRALNVASLILASAILAVAVCVLAVRAVGARAVLSWRFDALTFRAALGYGVIFFVNNLLAFLLLKSDLFLVNHFLGTGGAGIYSVSVQIADLLLMAPATLGTLLFPRLSAIQDPIERTQTCLQFARLAGGGMAVACLLAGITSPGLIPLIFGAAFYPAWVPLVILLPGIWLLALESVLVMHLAAKRLPILIPGLWLLGLVFNVGLNVWLLPRLGLAAAAMTSSLAYAVVAIGVFALFRRETGASLWEITVPRRMDWQKVVRRLQGYRGKGIPVPL
ncbi:MAG: oligosaccharide flippase family protein [Chloroflexi bacterium]|nr:oligosaccharide flippase family protein [Chloroflexota bacterium]